MTLEVGPSEKKVVAVAPDLGVRTPNDEVVTDKDGLETYRDAYCAAIRTFHSRGQTGANLAAAAPPITRWITPGRWRTRT
ncbi:MAG TPA: hypothetical protein VGT01_00550 [Candidatus Dormibacteraeota bacterium]|nr:hypothetical protein [Candidatus Dormibacteraeota bacterium]